MLWQPRKGWVWPRTAMMAAAIIVIACPNNASGAEDSARATATPGTAVTVPGKLPKPSASPFFRERLVSLLQLKNRCG